jgi:hypothetical protein
MTISCTMVGYFSKNLLIINLIQSLVHSLVLYLLIFIFIKRIDIMRLLLVHNAFITFIF